MCRHGFSLSLFERQDPFPSSTAEHKIFRLYVWDVCISSNVSEEFSVCILFYLCLLTCLCCLFCKHLKLQIRIENLSLTMYTIIPALSSLHSWSADQWYSGDICSSRQRQHHLCSERDVQFATRNTQDAAALVFRRGKVTWRGELSLVLTSDITT